MKKFLLLKTPRFSRKSAAAASNRRRTPTIHSCHPNKCESPEEGSFMHLASILTRVVPSLAAVAFSYAGTAAAADPARISGPIVHENLAIYFIHGAASDDPVPLTREEAMAKGVVRVY